MMLHTRHDLAQWLNQRQRFVGAVEVGCHRGDFCGPFRRIWAGDVFHCVDSYITQDGREHFADYAQLCRQMPTDGKSWQFHKLSSAEAALNFPAECLDFVYLDASHDYVNVAADLRAWFPSLRSGGMLAGHDFINGDWGRVVPAPTKEQVCDFIYGVKFAVEEFASEMGYEVSLIPDSIPSWYFIKR